MKRLRRSRFIKSRPFQIGLAFLALFHVSSKVVSAAPCCGGATAMPSLITGDDLAQINAAFSQSTVIGDAPPHGIPVFRDKDDFERTQTLTIEGAYRLGDSFQAGAQIPFVRKPGDSSAANDSNTGIGDVSIKGAYEALPERSYSAWKPKGFVFLQLTLPSSPSIYEAQAPLQTDARGRGFLQLEWGAAFLKNLGDFDFLLNAEAHKSFARSFQAQNGKMLELSPGWGGSFLLGAGYNLGSFRFGLSLSPIYEGPIDVHGAFSSRSSNQLAWNASAQASYLIKEEWTVALSYVDQTIFGPAKNVSLSRSVALSAQKRWAL